MASKFHIDGFLKPDSASCKPQILRRQPGLLTIFSFGYSRARDLIATTPGNSAFTHSQKLQES